MKISHKRAYKALNILVGYAVQRGLKIGHYSDKELMKALTPYAKMIRNNNPDTKGEEN